MFNRNQGRSILLSGVALALLPFAAMGADAPDANDGPAGVDEVIVTAQRRAESMQKASVAIDVLSADALQKAGITQATDITKLAPGVQITQGGAALQIYIRGVGDFTSSPLNDPAVAQNFDGVYSAVTQAVSGTLFDLERIEILKGPQGTLYGRNASGGALNLLPAQPKLGDYSGYGEIDLQNYSGVTAEGALNLPLSDSLAVRGAFQITSRDGYLNDGTNDDKHESGRLQALYKPSEDFSLRLFGSYQHLGGKGAGYALYEPAGTAVAGPMVPSDPWTSAIPALNTQLATVDRAATHGARTDFPFAQLDPALINQDIRTWNVHAQADWDLGFATLTFIPAYQDTRLSYLSEPTLSYWSVQAPTGAPQESRATSLEARLSGDQAGLKWVVGTFFYNQDQNDNTTVNLGPVADFVYGGSLNTRSYAAFGQTTYSLTDDLRLIGGLRYTKETKTVDASQNAALGSAGCAAGGGGPGNSCPVVVIDDQYAANKVNYRFGAEYDLAEDKMVFGTVATGFKSGGQTVALFPPYRPEVVTAYTLGSKNRFLGGKLQLNGELFYWDYKDHQENIAQPDANGNVNQTLINAGSATSKGASLDAIARITSADRLHLAVEYDDATYDTFKYTAYKSTSNGCTPYPGKAPYIIDCSGHELARTPKWSGSFGYSHSFDLPNEAMLEAGTDLSFGSQRWIQASFVPNTHVPAYVLLNADLAYYSPDGRYSVQAFVQNITNEAVYSGGEQNPFISGFIGAVISPPRTFGARLRYNF